jgi:hypothetical protein
VSARARAAAEAEGAIVRLDDLRRRQDTGPSRNQKAAAELAAAIVEALPALIQAARVVSESGEWSCQEPIPRIGRGGDEEEWEDCGACLGCRMSAAQEMLAEVEL